MSAATSPLPVTHRPAAPRAHTPARPAPRTTTPRSVRPLGDDPAHVAAVLVAAWVEVRAGRRPVGQLTPLLSPAMRRRLTAPGGGLHGGPPRPVRIRKVVARHPRPQVCEAVVLVERDHRVTAVAVRLERHLGRWRAVEVTAPEAGLPALATASLPTGPRDAFDEEAEEYAARTASAI